LRSGKPLPFAWSVTDSPLAFTLMFRIGETVNVPLAGSQVPVLEPPRASEKAETPALNW